MYLLAIIFPALYFALTFRLFRAIIALCLMCTGIGWIFASLWAVSIRNEAVTKDIIKNAVR